MDEGTRLPTFVIVGVPKAGTSSLALWLAEHPEVFMSATKELNFFNSDNVDDLDWYVSQFADAGAARARGEASPTYALSDDAMANLVRTLPGAPVVLLLRHPVDRVWSHYWYQRSIGRERRPFDEALADDLAGRDDLLRHLRGSTYAPILERIDRYAPDRSLVLLFDDLRDAPHDTFAEVCRFIGVDDSVEIALVGEALNPTTRVRSERVLGWMLKYHAWKRLPFGLAHQIDRINRVSDRPPAMDAATRARLLDHFASTVDVVEARLGRELPAWRV